jgi:histone H4
VPSKKRFEREWVGARKNHRVSITMQAGLGQAGCKRRKTAVLKGGTQGISKPGILRLARRGGVKQVSGLVYEETRDVLKTFLESVIKDAVVYTSHAHRKTVTASDVVYALKKQGVTLYGFGN